MVSAGNAGSNRGIGRDFTSRALPWFAILLLVTTVLAFLREYRADWRGLQRRYLSVRLAEGLLPPSPDEFHPGLQQMFLKPLGRTDRCTTCHLGIENPRLAHAPQPFATHPGDYLEHHPVDRFGCTACHGGDGLATEERAAHGDQPHSPNPLTPLELIEANCGVCHTGNQVPGAPILSRGRRLIDEYSCQACHDIPGFDARKFLGPSWDDVGQKVTRAWLTQWLEDPHSYLPRPHMPRFRLRPADRVSIVEFLLKRTGSVEVGRGPFDLAAHDAEHGGVLFRESRCITCHPVRGRGGSIGPDLGRVASKVTPEWLFQFIRNPHFFQPTTPMPRFGFTDAEVRDIVAYLMTEFAEEEPEESAPPGPTPEPGLLERTGLDSFSRYGCLACHELRGTPSRGRIGPDLSRIGSSTMEGRAFPEPDTLAHTLSSWIFQKIRSPASADSTARMPEYRLSEGEIGAITVALLSLRAPEVPGEFLAGRDEEMSYVPQGKVGELFRRYRCLSCHQLFGRGGTIAHAPLDVEGSKAGRDWIVDYIEEPYAVRVLIPERMPKLKITHTEAELLADYMGLVFVNDRIPPAIAFRTLPGEVETGARGFRQYGCIACHIAGESGGYVGPQLNSTGLRLNPWWVTRWLQEPGRDVPGTLHPDYGLTEEEAHALAAYLNTLRAEPR